MNGKTSEIYERLKDLRRQGDRAQIRSNRSRLAAFLNVVGRENIPERFAELIRKLDGPESQGAEADPSGSLIRMLEIKALADRVFGDEQKAETWLQRSNASLSGQKPADLLGDELGTAVVRELLERIDHGIFA
jgi:hypothetical protein